MPVAQSVVDTPGGVILGTTKLTQGCNAQAWVPPIKARVPAGLPTLSP